MRESVSKFQSCGPSWPGALAFVVLGALLMPISVSWAIGPERGITGSDRTTSPIASLLDGPGPLAVEGTILDREALLHVYAARDYQPVWADHPAAAAALLAAISEAAADGIDPAGMGSAILAAAIADPGLSVEASDILLTDRFIRYASALAQGQVDPASTEDDWVLRRPMFDPAPLLDRVAAGEDLASMVVALAPHRAEYVRLRGALARYTQIAAAGGWSSLPAMLPSDPRYDTEFLPPLRQRLAVEGDLVENQAAGPGSEPALTAAVRRFQARHGLDVDGHVGKATLAALNVSAADRVAQLRLALERMRAMPHDWAATRVSVNIPFATLVLYRADKPVLTSRVVVGDPKHPTPVLGSAIQSVLFNPAWDVPSSIVRNEMQPRLVRDPSYLARNHFLLLGHGDGSSTDVDWTQSNILANGWRVQQQPGPWNALGIVMFDFPSPFAVYLHDTPARSAFALAARGLSHGCVRVEAANALAGELLGASASPDAIQKIVADGTTERHPLAEPMAVYLTYVTAQVDEDGTVQFRDDLYGRDKRLLAALSTLDGLQSPQIALGAEHRLSGVPPASETQN